MKTPARNRHLKSFLPVDAVLLVFKYRSALTSALPCLAVKVPPPDFFKTNRFTFDVIDAVTV
jgi:hypothetical protein